MEAVRVFVVVVRPCVDTRINTGIGVGVGVGDRTSTRKASFPRNLWATRRKRESKKDLRYMFTIQSLRVGD
jgi:hypothetical protein